MEKMTNGIKMSDYVTWDLAIRRDGKDPAQEEWFDKYFKYNIAKPLFQHQAAISYPKTDDGLKRWNTEAEKHKCFTFYLVKRRIDGKLIKISDMFMSAIKLSFNCASGEDLNNLTSFISLIEEAAGITLSDEKLKQLKDPERAKEIFFSGSGKDDGVLKEIFSKLNIDIPSVDLKTMKFADIEKEFNEHLSELTELCWNITQTIVEQKTGESTIERIPAANIDVVLEDGKIITLEPEKSEEVKAEPKQEKQQEKPQELFTLLKGEGIAIPDPTALATPNIQSIIMDNLIATQNLSPEEANKVRAEFGENSGAYQEYIRIFGTPTISKEYIRQYRILYAIKYDEAHILLDRVYLAVTDILKSEGIIMRSIPMIDNGNHPELTSENFYTINSYGDTIHYELNKSITYTEVGKEPLIIPLKPIEVVEDKKEKPKTTKSNKAGKKKNDKTGNTNGKELPKEEPAVEDGGVNTKTDNDIKEEIAKEESVETNK